MLAATLKAAEGLTAADRLLLWNSVAAAARLIADERQPESSRPKSRDRLSSGGSGYCTQSNRRRIRLYVSKLKSDLLASAEGSHHSSISTVRRWGRR
jgi:hypothetical protein